MDAMAAWTALRDVTDRVTARADEITVALVVNKRAAVAPDRLDDRSTEYLSDDEASQLLGGLRDVGFRTRYYDGELAFIAHATADPRLGTASPHLIVYNLAQTGRDAGRKSLVPSLCALQGIATCNSGAYAVSLARNKLHVHAILERFGLPTPATWCYASRRGWLLGRRPPPGLTLITKALHESASIGLDQGAVGTINPAFEAMLATRSEALGQPMVVQAFVEGREFEAPVVRVGAAPTVLGPAIVTVGGTDRLGRRILDYDAVARDDYAYAMPLAGDRETVAEVARVAAAAYDVLGLSGFARVDFRIDDAGRAFVIDVATSPHLVWHSSYARVFAAEGWRHGDMLACMVAVNAARLGWLHPSDQTWMSDMSSPRPIDHQTS